jgi:DNA-directed RNA polymerase subunit RPC12/RpoP
MEDNLFSNTCARCSRAFNQKHGLIYCEDCSGVDRDIVKSKGPFRIKEETKEAFCLTCLERSNSLVKVFRSDCIKNGHAIEEGLHSHRTISINESQKDLRSITKKAPERVIIKPDLIKRSS